MARATPNQAPSRSIRLYICESKPGYWKTKSRVDLNGKYHEGEWVEEIDGLLLAEIKRLEALKAGYASAVIVPVKDCPGSWGVYASIRKSKYSDMYTQRKRTKEKEEPTEEEIKQLEYDKQDDVPGDIELT